MPCALVFFVSMVTGSGAPSCSAPRVRPPYARPAPRRPAGRRAPRWANTRPRAGRVPDTCRSRPGRDDGRRPLARSGARRWRGAAGQRPEVSST
ncbi:hypothetical protein ACFSM7_00740 [Clavibacter michiganensis subsp. tessellarius]|uniref:hypothetical protein n=1 Tax=Clavibacter tessellarius TaxID=31965 RepID=UPI00363AC05E